MPVVNIPIKSETSKKEVVTVVSQSAERVCYFNRKQCAYIFVFQSSQIRYVFIIEMIRSLA